MIYSYPSSDDPIRQGDIFWPVPRIELFPLDAHDFPLIVQPGDEGVRQIEWEDLVASPFGAQAIVNVRAAWGIVITQDCDAERCQSLTLSEILPFSKVERSAENENSLKARVTNVTRQARLNQKWYYLPVDTRAGLGERMAADFLQVFQVPAQMLRAHRKELRRARLNNEVAWPHFRERVAEFFRRYPYNEWYPLDSEEMDFYESKNGAVERYQWQMQPPR